MHDSAHEKATECGSGLMTYADIAPGWKYRQIASDFAL